MLVESPFPSYSWDLPVPPVREAHLKIFHEEGCNCPTDAVLLPVYGLSDYQGVLQKAELVEDSRWCANRVQESVDQDFS